MRVGAFGSARTRGGEGTAGVGQFGPIRVKVRRRSRGRSGGRERELTARKLLPALDRRRRRRRRSRVPPGLTCKRVLRLRSLVARGEGRSGRRRCAGGGRRGRGGGCGGGRGGGSARRRRGRRRWRGSGSRRGSRRSRAGRRRRHARSRRRRSHGRRRRTGVLVFAFGFLILLLRVAASAHPGRRG